MTPVQMKYFDAVCHYQSISSAAAVLHISQPTITVAIQTLEKEIGVNLFVRRGKQLILTKEGAIIWSKISPILNSIEQLENDIKDITHNKNHISIRTGVHATQMSAVNKALLTFSNVRRCITLIFSCRRNFSPTFSLRYTLQTVTVRSNYSPYLVWQIFLSAVP